MNDEARKDLIIISETHNKFLQLIKPQKRLTKEQFNVACDLLCVLAIAGRCFVVNTRDIPNMPEMVARMLSNMRNNLERYR